MEPIKRHVLKAYVEQRAPLPDSDLDNEQPVTLHVRTTLGDLRKLQREHYAATEVVMPGAVALEEAD